MTNDSRFSSGDYWEARYRAGGTSGAGSYGRLASFKATFVNAFIADNRVQSVLDLGCGDGNLLSLLDIPNYVGTDVSPTALTSCASRFASRRNYVFLPPARLDHAARTDLALSIDVIFHLTEDAIFIRHIADLFGRATRFVLIYASNFDSAWQDQHVRHRRFSDQVAVGWPTWHLLAYVPNRFLYDPVRPDDTSFADFFIYGRTMEQCIIRLPEA